MLRCLVASMILRYLETRGTRSIPLALARYHQAIGIRNKENTTPNIVVFVMEAITNLDASSYDDGLLTSIVLEGRFVE